MTFSNRALNSSIEAARQAGLSGTNTTMLAMVSITAPQKTIGTMGINREHAGKTGVVARRDRLGRPLMQAGASCGEGPAMPPLVIIAEGGPHV